MNTRSFLLAASFGLAVAFALIGCDGGGLTDKRDGKKYKSVKIGEQVWMAENLNFEVDGSRCYDDKAENCDKYGRLYNRKIAQEICPKGWHLPTNIEWDKLLRNADGTIGSGSTKSPYGSETAGRFLKATSGWNDNNGTSGNGEDKFGFTALPGGEHDYSFGHAGSAGYWWSATWDNAYGANSQNMSYGNVTIWSNGNGKRALFSVRCVKD